MADAVIAILILFPVALTFILKSNSASAFLVLCGSFVVITYAGANIKDLSHSLRLQVNSSTINLLIFGMPALLTLLFVRKAFHGGIGMILNLVNAACMGCLLALVAVPLLNVSTRTSFTGTPAWDNLQKVQAPVIVTGFILSILLLWFGKVLSGGHSKKHKKH
jgi:hypothetical protein